MNLNSTMFKIIRYSLLLFISQNIGKYDKQFLPYMITDMINDKLRKTKHNKPGVINDPLDQTYSLASSYHCFRFVFCYARFLKVGTDGRKTCAKKMIPTGRVDQKASKSFEFSDPPGPHVGCFVACFFLDVRTDSNIQKSCDFFNFYFLYTLMEY